MRPVVVQVLGTISTLIFFLVTKRLPIRQGLLINFYPLIQVGIIRNAGMAETGSGRGGFGHK